MTARPILYDITRLFSRVFNRTPNGIDRVDFAFADHFLSSGQADGYGVMMTAIGPKVFSQSAGRQAVELIRRHWGEDAGPDQDEDLTHVAAALCDASPRRRFSKGRAGQFADALRWIARHGISLGKSPKSLAGGAVYLNVSQFPLQCDVCMRWLGARSDIAGVFFLHDLLPLRFPEYFRPSEHRRHEQRLAVLARRGSAAIVSSQAVRSELARHMTSLGRPDLQILVAPLAPDSIFLTPESAAFTPEASYFVMCGTIEPRKNHLLVLHAWRDLVDQMGEEAPKLVLVGERGWENEHVIDLLERSPRLRQHVVEVSGLPTPGLKRLLLGAKALLMPSFGEGYGLPVIEALALGVPVIASDIPIFSEIGGGRLTMIDPSDGPRWREAIRAFADDATGVRQQALARLYGYSSPTWPSTFLSVEAFLDQVTDNRPLNDSRLSCPAVAKAEPYSMYP